MKHALSNVRGPEGLPATRRAHLVWQSPSYLLGSNGASRAEQSDRSGYPTMIPLRFEASEYRTRLQAIREEMALRNLDLLVVNDVANQHYITGYDGWSFIRHRSCW